MTADAVRTVLAECRRGGYSVDRQVPRGAWVRGARIAGKEPEGMNIYQGKLVAPAKAKFAVIVSR